MAAAEQYAVSDCQNLSSENSVYVLQDSISGDSTCISIDANNITFDCSGYTIAYGSNSSGYGIHVQGVNSTKVQSCLISKSGGVGSNNCGIYLNSSNSALVTNNSITTNGSDGNYGIFANNSFYLNISLNVISAIGSGDENGAVEIKNSNNTVIVDNSISAFGNMSNHGVCLHSSSFSNVSGNNMSVDGLGGENFGVHIEYVEGILINNNALTTNGVADNHGLMLINGSNMNVTDNVIITNGSGGRNMGIYIKNGSSILAGNNSISTNGLGDENVGILWEISGIVLIRNNSISTSGNSMNYGLWLWYSSYINISSNIVSTNGTSGDNFGIFFQGNSFSKVSLNTIHTGGTENNIVIILQTNSSNNLIIGNILSLAGARWDYGIYLYAGSNYNIIGKNNITTFGGEENRAIYLIGNNLYNNITGNNITLVGNSSSGIVLVDSNSTIVSSNIIRTEGNLSFAVSLVSTGGAYASNNIFYNNIFNSTDAQVNISSTVAVNNFSTILAAGANIMGYSFIGGNYYDNSTVGGLKGFSCFDSDWNGICDSAYVIAGNNTDFYPLSDQWSLSCENLTLANRRYVLEQNISSADTCIRVKADSITLDCSGFNISYGSSSSGYGIHVQGVNSTKVQNCLISKSGSVGDENYGIYIENSNGSIIVNNSVFTNGNSMNYGFYSFGSLNVNVTLNSFSTGGIGSDNFGIFLMQSSFNNVTLNSIDTNGTENNLGIIVQTNSDNNIVSRNSVSPKGARWGFGIYVYDNSVFNLISRNNVTTFGGEENSAIYFDGNNLYNNITGNNLSTAGNSSSGIVLVDSNSTIASSNIIRTVGNLSFAVSLVSAGGAYASNNIFYNNIFNSTDAQVNISSTAAVNNFSTILAAGTNIMGYSFIGGNYYDNSTVGGLKGFSCSDSDRNGICDSSYELAENSTDFYPLTILPHAPVRSNGQPASLPFGTSSSMISLVTNEAATCKYSLFANAGFDVMENTFSSTGGVSHSQLVTGLTNGGSYTYYVKCSDSLGNKNSDDFVISFSVSPDVPSQSVSSRSSGGGGSGGGGDGSGGIPIAPSDSVSHYFAALDAGQDVEMNISKASIALTRIVFSPKSDVSGLSISVKAVKQEEIPVPIKNSFQYIQISASTEITAPVVIEFAVSSSWLSENSFTAGSVGLNRLVDSSWVKLETKLKNQDGLKHYYSAESPGFSYFAITGGEIVNVTAPAPAAPETQVQFVNESKRFDVVELVKSAFGCRKDLLWWAILIIILFFPLDYECAKIIASRRYKTKIHVSDLYFTLTLLPLTAGLYLINLFICLPNWLFYIYAGVVLVIFAHLKKHGGLKVEP